MIVNSLFYFVLSFVLATLLSPLVLFVCKKLKAQQTILHYVDAHLSKQGTPTMGGFIFIIAFVVSSFCALWGSFTYAIMTIIITLGYGILGFLDDYIKISTRQNEGLSPVQKIVGQVGIAIIIAFFVFYYVGSEIYLPFVNIQIDCGVFIIPLVIMVFVSLVNSVNLIDGLDGLCGGVSLFYVFSFAMLLTLTFGELNSLQLVETKNLILLCSCFIGSVLGFLVLNSFPAKIFMGDTGSLAIGGFLSALAVFSGMEFYILIIGLPYVITSISDIIQVAYYKKTKKRIFLMAPLHHHFEKKGFNENKIVLIYIIATIILGTITFILTSCFGVR